MSNIIKLPDGYYSHQLMGFRGTWILANGSEPPLIYNDKIDEWEELIPDHNHVNVMVTQDGLFWCGTKKKDSS